MSTKTEKNKQIAQESTQTLNASDVMDETTVLEMEQPEERISSFGSDFNFPIQEEVKEVPANVILKLEETHRRGMVNIDGEDFVLDPETNRQRKARLVKGVNSIWADEQDGVLKIDKDTINRNKRSLEFNNGVCIIPSYDQTAIQFATVCNSNMNNNNRFGVKPIYFNIWNPIAEAERQNKTQMQMLTAMQTAATMPAEKMYRHAVYLGVSLADEMGNKATEQAVRNQYMLKANQHPEKFLASAENPAVDISWAVKTLINNGTIDLNTQEGNAIWKDGGFIAAVPKLEKPADYLTQYALTDGEKNRAFLNTVKRIAKIN